ncbi:hypothetical protein ACIO93_28005 [Streptomyces sp. NPDC087903]|uniref:hypothetical protein n=1 Tax=Streptomyces sp. NPDC087903 TaxID=3365819 RepID=UPI003811B011
MRSTSILRMPSLRHSASASLTCGAVTRSISPARDQNAGAAFVPRHQVPELGSSRAVNAATSLDS